MALPLNVQGPVLAEVFTVALFEAELLLTGPCGAAPWHIEIGNGEDPLDVVNRIVEAELDHVWLVHSTSWRWERGAVTLSFVVVISAEGIGSMDAVPVVRADLARSSATSAPPSIEYRQVLEHGLRHLTWLAKEDQVVQAILSDEWHEVLDGYVPEPFRQLVDGGR